MSNFEAYHELISTLPDPLLITSSTGTLLAVNPAALQVLGGSAKDWREKNLIDVVQESEEDVLRFLDTCARSRQMTPGTFTLNPDGQETFRLEGAVVRPWSKEEEAILLLRMQPKETATKRFVALNEKINQLSREIHLRKQVEKQLMQAKEEAEAANEAKSQFLANMSHEIRTPLTTVTGFLPLLREDASGQQLKYLDIVQKGAERLQNLLETILTHARLESGHADLDVEAIDLADETEDIIQLLQRKADDKDLRFSFQKQMGDIPVRLDPGALTSILNNLVSNAIKFTDEGSITVTVGSEADRAYVRISDTGVGMDPEFLQRVFEPFEQESTGMSRSHEGSGLGLAIVKQLTKAMDGEISVESAPQKGTTFTVSFPLVETTPEQKPTETASKHRPTRLPGTDEPHLLLVEDNPDIQMLIQSLFEGRYNLDTAETADEALDKARTAPFDLVLLDIHLKGKGNGEEVLQALRKDERYRNVPIVALTAHALPGDRERFLDMGFSAYQGKPFTVSEITDLVSRLLTSRVG